MENTQKTTFLYNLLIGSRYRLWRHVLFILAMFIIAINQVFDIYMENVGVSQIKLLLITSLVFISYVFVGYFNLKYLIPKYFLKKKYGKYAVGLLFATLSVVILDAVIEYVVCFVWKLVPVRPVVANMSSFQAGFLCVIEYLSLLFLYASCTTGISVTVLLKDWFVENQRIQQLEKERIHSEVEQLKEQINPLFLFKILNKAGYLAKTDTNKASDMLMKLSLILRYQLYDCGREKVFLNSEITFLRNYLELQGLYFDDLKFTITTKGDIRRFFLAPLLFIPFLQFILDNIYSHDANTRTLDVEFETKGNILEFRCNYDTSNLLESTCLLNIKKRLAILYPDCFELFIEKEKKENNIIILQLHLQ